MLLPVEVEDEFYNRNFPKHNLLILNFDSTLIDQRISVKKNEDK